MQLIMSFHRARSSRSIDATSLDLRPAFRYSRISYLALLALTMSKIRAAPTLPVTSSWSANTTRRTGSGKRRSLTLPPTGRLSRPLSHDLVPTISFQTIQTVARAAGLEYKAATFLCETIRPASIGIQDPKIKRLADGNTPARSSLQMTL